MVSPKTADSPAPWIPQPSLSIAVDRLRVLKDRRVIGYGGGSGGGVQQPPGPGPAQRAAPATMEGEAV